LEYAFCESVLTAHLLVELLAREIFEPPAAVQSKEYASGSSAEVAYPIVDQAWLVKMIIRCWRLVLGRGVSSEP